MHSTRDMCLPQFLAAISLVLSICLSVQDDAIAEEELSGSNEFRIACSVCHGVEGKGDGPLADTLKTKPADLTQIANNNDGVFPFRRVIEMIDGRSEVVTHGPREMPVWGERFAEEEFMTARARILELTLYLESIQAK